MKFYTIVLCLFSVSNILYTQTDDKILAKAGKINISSSEFKERFELTPWPKGENPKASVNPQLDFLYTLVAEKLLAQDAHFKGYDTSQSYRNAFKTIEKLYIRDALYKHEITNKFVLAKSDLEKAFEKNRYLLKLDFIKVDSQKKIGEIYKSLEKGSSFYSALETQGGTKDSSITISFGELDESIENMLYKLKPGEYTPPVSVFDKYVIFRLLEKKDRLAEASRDKEQIFSEARKIALKRLNDKYYRKYYNSFFTGKKVETNGFLFWSFADKVAKILKEKKENSFISDKDKAHLTIDDFLRIRNEFGRDSLSIPFIHFENEPVTLKQFIDEFAYDGFYCNSYEPKEIRTRLDSRVKIFIENELLAREGYKSGFQNLPEVKKSIKMWEDNYLAQLLKSAIMDSVKISSSENVPSSNAGNTGEYCRTLVNIVEILTDNLDTVEIILDQLKTKKDIKELAEKYSKRESTKETKGEFGFFPATSYGEIGRIASKMQIGEIYGPLKTEEGYSIFKLIDKKIESIDNYKAKEELDNNVPNDLITQKYLQTLTEYTARLAKSYGVSINNELLNTVNALNLNLFAYRYMGFGGKIMAVPLTVPFTEWVKEWKKSDNSLP